MATITPNLITAPTTEAISVAELKRQLGIASDDSLWDNQLEICRVAARQYYERRTGRTVHETEWEIVLDEFPDEDEVELPRATPLISITSLKYTDSDGETTTWDSSNYIADTDSLPGKLVLGYGKSWPSATLYPASPIKIRYKAGIETTSPITEARDDDKAPILLIAAALFENRAGWLQDGKISPTLDFGLQMLLEARTVSYAF